MLRVEDIVTLPAGTEAAHELLHHLKFKYCPTSSTVHLRVSEDVLQNGQVVPPAVRPAERSGGAVPAPDRTAGVPG